MIDYIEDKFGEVALAAFLLCTIISGVFGVMLWVVSVVVWGWPAFLPIAVVGWFWFDWYRNGGVE